MTQFIVEFYIKHKETIVLRDLMIVASTLSYQDRLNSRMHQLRVKEYFKE